MAEEQVVLKAQDMAEDIQQTIFSLSQEILAQSKIEKDIAAYVKKELDSKYGHAWHVIVGKNFGSYVTHEAGFFVYYYIGDLAFLVFKTA